MRETVFPYQIRWAREQEWDRIMVMVWSTFLKYEAADYTPEGIRNFREFITDEKLRRGFLMGNYQVMVALDEKRVIGTATLRNRNHLSLLFVDEQYHHRGVGTELMERLCAYLRDEEGERSISLKAAPYAVDFYKKLGFVSTGSEEQVAGIRVTPMEKLLMPVAGA